MSKKTVVALGILASLLYSASALSNPASTEYVKSSIDALRSELNNQSSARYSELNSIIHQLTGKTDELMTSLNQLIIQMTGLNHQMNEQGTNATNSIEMVQQQVNQLPIITHTPGEVFQGGLIFYVDSSQQHGLMVSLNNIESEIEWRNGEGGDRIVNAKARGLGAGEMNTRLIIAQQTIDQQEGQFAALLAASYQILADGISPCPTAMGSSLPCYGGWYLPSVDELALLHHSLKQLGLGGLEEKPYWSSTESDATQAWLVDCASGEPQIRDKSTSALVRAIHTF